MVSEEAISTSLGVAGNITAVTLFLSTVPTFYGIWKRKSVEQYSPMPYLASFFNCGLWVLYGMPFVHPNSMLVVTTNGAGLAIEFVFLLIFLKYSDSRKRLKVVLIWLLEIIVFVGLTLFVLILVHKTQKRSTIVGSFGVAANILMYASPLSVMKLVITTKSVEYMPFPLSLFCFLNGLCWFLYALFPFDPFIAVPNGIGGLLGILQLILYGTFYKSTKRMLAARKEKAEMGLAVMDSSIMNNGNVSKINP
uniref:bidirectional sugar transporter SWEET4-like n=1 Tax=Erigeron canadensis TaxID=72917 RepID=UPI001CB91988|nr:bidirectional sugar transporter SWEET4-like [Erigeron canadensis]